MSLITRERAIRNLGSRTTTTAENKVIDSMVAAASDWITAYCKRLFVARPYDELKDGNDQQTMLLNEYPVLAIESVNYGPSTVLQVKNTSASVQRANVAVSELGITLISVASGVTTTDTSVLFSAYATLGTMATAIAAISGWTAQVPSTTYTNWPSADLRQQGAFYAKDVWAGLKTHVYQLSEYQISRKDGILTRVDALTQSDFVANLNSADIATWFGGSDYWRIIYTAGYENIPEAVQEACAELAIAMFYQTSRDPGLAQEQVPSVVSRTPVLNTLGMQPHILKLLAPYRKYR